MTEVSAATETSWDPDDWGPDTPLLASNGGVCTAAPAVGVARTVIGPETSAALASARVTVVVAVEDGLCDDRACVA